MTGIADTTRLASRRYRGRMPLSTLLSPARSRLRLAAPALRTLPRLALLLGLLTPHAVLAQPAAWLVLPAPSDGSDPARLIEASASLARLLAAQQTPALDPGLVAATIRRDHSEAPTLLSRAEIEEVRRQVDSATRNLSFGELEAARSDIEAIGEVRDRAIEGLNREIEVAVRALDGCLLGVRWLHVSRQQGALERAMTCVRAHPGIEPSRRYHPDEILELLEQARARIASLPEARLSVSTLDGRACRIRFNGISIGMTPHRIEHLRPGRLSVQVECDPDQPGRVHRLDLRPGQNTLEIDATLEAALRLEPSPHLRYASSEARARLLPAHASALAALTGTDEALSVRPDPAREDLLYLDRLREGEVIATVRAGVGDLRRALERLLAGDSIDLTGSEPRPIARLGASEEAREIAPRSGARPRPLRRGWQHLTASLLIAAGIGLAAMPISNHLHAGEIASFEGAAPSRVYAASGGETAQLALALTGYAAGLAWLSLSSAADDLRWWGYAGSTLLLGAGTWMLTEALVRFAREGDPALVYCRSTDCSDYEYIPHEVGAPTWSLTVGGAAALAGGLALGIVSLALDLGSPLEARLAAAPPQQPLTQLLLRPGGLSLLHRF